MKNFINFLPPWVETNLQPAFYDKQSGTCLQQTARMYAKVNQLVRIANEQWETIQDYINKFIELKDFVEDYFENLDVQEEINNKLDEMAEDGTLYAIISRFTTPIINQQNARISVLESADEVLNDRIDNIVALPEGSTQGDAELADIRIGAFGCTYQTAGSSVRNQIKDVDDKITSYIDGVEQSTTDYLDLDIVVGGYNRSGEFVNTGNFANVRSTVLDIPTGYQYATIKFDMRANYAGLTFFADSNGNILKPLYQAYSETSYIIPSGASKLYITSSHTTSPAITAKFDNKFVGKLLTTHDNSNFIFFGSQQRKFVIAKSGSSFDITVKQGTLYFCFNSTAQITKTIDSDTTYTIANEESLIFDLDDNEFKVEKWGTQDFVRPNKAFIILAHNSYGNIIAGVLSQNYNNDQYSKIEEITNPLYGKKIVAIGDSMVKGHTLSDSQTWLAKIADKNHMTYTNYGVNGCTMTYVDSSGYDKNTSVYARYSSMADDADYVVVFAGTNDIQRNITLGTENSEDPTNFYGALNNITQGLLTKYPNKKICFITPYARSGLSARTDTYVNAIKTACKNNGGIPVFDNVTNGGICWTNTAQLNSLTLNDTYHLNDAGMTWVTSKYEAFFKSL